MTNKTLITSNICTVCISIMWNHFCWKITKVWTNCEPFNRLYMLMGANSTMFLWGETIHDTLQTHSLYTHSSLHGLSDLIEVPMEHGHLSHFRNGYNIYWNTYPIKEFHFDFNYFQNYYLPILKRLDYSIRFWTNKQVR